MPPLNLDTFAPRPRPSAHRTPPGPPAYLPGWHAWRFIRNPLGFLANATRKYGDIALFRLADVDVYYVSHPDLVRDVLHTKRASFTISAMRSRLEAVMGTGLLTARGELHARQRRLMQPLFRKSRIEGYTRDMVDHALSVRDRWQPDSEIDLTGEMLKLAMSVVAKSLFNHDIGRDSADVSRNLATILGSYTRIMSPWFRLYLVLPFAGARKFWKAVRELDDVIYRMIEERRRARNGGDDVLGLLMRERDAQTNAYMTEKQLRDELITLFLAGHETTANALGWTIYLLAQNPEADARLHEEVKSILAGRPRLEAADPERMSYARKILLEAIRLYPPAWHLARSALVDVELAGYLVPKGSAVLMSQYVMHRDARFYSEPERFLPERWSDEFLTGLPRGAYFPFGGGDRHCIGEGFAWQEAMLILGTLAARWRFELVEGQRVRLHPSITLRPKARIRMRVRSRD